MSIDFDQKVKQLGLVLPEPFPIPAGIDVPFSMIRIIGNRCLVSGHGPQHADGSLTSRLGQVGSDLNLEQGIEAARMVALTMMGTLQRELGSLNRIQLWVKTLGMVNSAPGFDQQLQVMNGFSGLLVEVFGEDCGMSTRSAVGMAALPFSIPVEVEAEILLKD